jgi:hypothetical protein
MAVSLEKMSVGAQRTATQHVEDGRDRGSNGWL